MKRRSDIYGGKDPRDLAFYAPADVARIVRMPPPTVHAWAFGAVRRGERWPALIVPASSSRLSFRNVVELHVLRVLRHRKLRLDTIRDATQFIRAETGSAHPFADVDVQTDTRRIFVEFFGQLIDTGSGQVAIVDMLERYLARIERDEDGLARRLFPFTHDEHTDERLIVVDPTRRFGRPVLATANVETSVIAERLHAGESARSIARDFEIAPRLVLAAGKFEDEMWKREAA